MASRSPLCRGAFWVSGCHVGGSCLPSRSPSRPKIYCCTDSRLKTLCRTDHVCFNLMRMSADSGFVLVLVLSKPA